VKRGWDGTPNLSKLGQKYNDDWNVRMKVAIASPCTVLSSLWAGRSTAMQATPHHGRKKVKDSFLTFNIPARKPGIYLVIIYSLQVAFFGVQAVVNTFRESVLTIRYVMAKTIARGT
jgi:hypothetical protein